MNLSDLRTELLGRGFEAVISPSQANAYINDAYQAICDMADWPWLEDTTSGAAPLTIADFGKAIYVHDTTNGRPLAELDTIHLSDDHGTDFPDATGTPRNYWIDGTSILRVYPVQAVTLSVRYFKSPPVLADDADVPIVPSGHHLLIVTIAHLKATKFHVTDEQVDVAILNAEIQETVGRMIGRFGVRSSDPDYMRVTGASTDW